MKTVPLIVLVWIMALSSYAQDTLYRTNGKIAAVTIQNTDYGNIYYKFAGDTASPIFTISKSFINKIVYHDGHTETFESPAVETKKIQPAVNQYDSQDSLKNMIHFKASDLAFGSVAFEYEHFMKSGNFSIRIPVAAGFVFNNQDIYGLTYYKNKIFSTGLGFYFYPFPAGNFRFFMGTSVNYWKNKDYINEYNQGTAYFSKESYTKRNAFSFLLEAGIVFQMSEHLVLSTDAGFGPGNQKYKYTYTSSGYNSNRTTGEFIFDLHGSIKIGYKF